MENKNLKHTERLENIFYGDLFKIENKTCLIFGYGKTKACRSCLETENDELGLDFICLTEENNQLYGHHEFISRHVKIEDPINGVSPRKCGFHTLRAFSPLIPIVCRLFIYLMAYVIL
ncbi:hypothetical protein ACOT7R_14170 [Clostridium perfringens]|uniref:hypothetical protein n=1 Tax=Clostridium perfringens TaxID=1502 RepID=UPI003BACFC80